MLMYILHLATAAATMHDGQTFHGNDGANLAPEQGVHRSIEIGTRRK